MGWQARLELQYRAEDGRCVARHLHEGPLRILQTLYPEGPGVAHNVLVHPPGGLVGGDSVAIEVDAGPQAHGLVTTPGAARFYRSEGPAAVQRTRLRVADGARLEWLPLESLCYSGCVAENEVRLDLAPGAQVIGWDVTGFGLPHSGQPFVRGRYVQHLELPGCWIERAVVAADDQALLDGPAGMAGHRCLATLYFAAGSDLGAECRERALALANECIAAHPGVLAGATAPNAQVVVVRVLAPVVEPAMALLRALRVGWRSQLWQLGATEPRLWAT